MPANCSVDGAALQHYPHGDWCPACGRFWWAPGTESRSADPDAAADPAGRDRSVPATSWSPPPAAGDPASSAVVWSPPPVPDASHPASLHQVVMRADPRRVRSRMGWSAVLAIPLAAALVARIALSAGPGALPIAVPAVVALLAALFCAGYWAMIRTRVELTQEAIEITNGFRTRTVPRGEVARLVFVQVAGRQTAPHLLLLDRSGNCLGETSIAATRVEDRIAFAQAAAIPAVDGGVSTYAALGTRYPGSVTGISRHPVLTALVIVFLVVVGAVVWVVMTQSH